MTPSDFPQLAKRLDASLRDWQRTEDWAGDNPWQASWQSPAGQVVAQIEIAGSPQEAVDRLERASSHMTLPPVAENEWGRRSCRWQTDAGRGGLVLIAQSNLFVHLSVSKGVEGRDFAGRITAAIQEQ